MGTMTKDVNERLDTIVEDEVRRGWKVVAIDPYFQDMLEASELPRIAYLRFVRMNPARKREVAELVQRRYHADLQDPTILSEAQVKALAATRGEWTAAMEQELAGLTERSKSLMQQLYVADFASGSEQWLVELESIAATVRDAMKEDAEATARFNRWLDYTPDREAEYTALYAEAQQRTKYIPEVDFQALSLYSIEVSDLVEQLDDLKSRIENYYALIKVRQEQATLQVKRDRLFEQTAEARRDQAEELARLYVTATVCDADGTQRGKIAKSFDGLWEFPFDVLQHFTTEAYLFHNHITSEARAYLEVFGFLGPRPPSFFGVEHAYDLDDGHLFTFHWIRFYQQIYDMSPVDRPSDDIIDNDVELDKWRDSYMMQAAARASMERAKAHGNSGSGSTMPAPRSALPQYGG
jgi:hypothetical protein